jgi:hypothetical protein
LTIGHYFFLKNNLHTLIFIFVAVCFSC